MTPNDHIILVERMTRMESKIDTLLENQANRKEFEEKSNERHNELEDRLTAVETRNKVIASVGGVFLFLATFFQKQIHTVFS